MKNILWHIDPLYLKKQFGLSDGEPHRVLHSCDCCNTSGSLRSTQDVWQVKTVKRSVSQSLEVKPNDSRWTTGRVRWAENTSVSGHEVPGKVDGWSGTAGWYSQPPKVANMDKSMKDPFVRPFRTWNTILASIWSASVREPRPWHLSLEQVKKDIIWKIRSFTLPLLTLIRPQSINLVFSLLSLSPLLTHTL